MLFDALLVLSLLTLTNVQTGVAAPAAELPERNGVYSGEIYGELARTLAAYLIAQSFCFAYFPVKCTSKARTAPPETTTKLTTTTKLATVNM
jgi:hypothetical protein